MDNKKNSLKEFFSSRGITQNDISEKTGMSQSQISQLLNGRNNFGKRTADVFRDAFGLNPIWLIHGEGEMLLEPPPSEQPSRIVPVVNLDGVGGFSSNAVVDTAECVIGTMSFNADIAHDGDFALMITGDSMTPLYPAGSYVLLREIQRWREYLELGLCYVLLLADGRRVIKEVRAGGDAEHFTLCSVNPTYDPVEIARSFIQRIFMVVLSLRKDIL